MFKRKSKIINKRYERQVALIGKKGQKQLSNACVMIIGAGGLGNIASKFLASAGVGKLIIVDHDIVEKSNLGRQFLFNKKSVKKAKAKALKNTLKKINPYVKVIPIVKKVAFDTEVMLMEKAIAHKVKVILDCTDNMEAAYIVESMALNLEVPLVFGKTSKYSGIVTIIQDSFLRANYPNKQLNSDNAVFAPIGGIIGSLQASLALKLIIGLKTDDYILYYDSLNNEMIKYKKGARYGD